MQRNTLLILSFIIVCSSVSAQDPGAAPATPPAAGAAGVDATMDPPPTEIMPMTEMSSPAASAAATTATSKPIKKNLRHARKRRSHIPAGSDQPDLRKEEEFHALYEKYNSQPTSEESWEKAIGSRKSEVYKIQNKDTLWDVSNTFFGDANYWPKIWSLNVNEISNPHEIDPNMSIQFFPGSMADAPTLGMVENGKLDGVRVASNDDKAVLPKSKKRMPVLKVLPESLPAYRSAKLSVPPPTLDLPLRANLFPEQPEYLTHYVSPTSPAAVGQIIETEMGTSTAAEYQYIIVRLDSAADKNLVVVKELENIENPASSEVAVHLIEVQGAVQVLEKVNDRENLYRALVKKNIQPVEVGSRLITGTLPMFDPTPTAVNSQASALIIGGQYENDRKLFGTRATVFLSGGSRQGFQEGQSLQVYSDIRNRNPKSKAQTNDRAVGVIKIIKVNDNFSTAYVTKATDDIFVGDHVGSKAVIATGPVMAQPSGDTSGQDLKAADDLSLDDSGSSSPVTPALDSHAAPEANPGDSSGGASGDLDLEL